MSVQFSILPYKVIGKEYGFYYIVLPLTEQYRTYIKNTIRDKNVTYNINGIKFKAVNILSGSIFKEIPIYEWVYNMVENNSVYNKATVDVVIPKNYDPIKNVASEVKPSGIRYSLGKVNSKDYFKYLLGRLGMPRDLVIVKLNNLPKHKL